MTEKSAASPVALVTGASRGIGRAIAIELGRAGYDLLINYASNEQAAREVQNQIENLGQRAHIVRADVAVAEDRADLVKFAVESFGRLDLLVNNAGIAPRQRVDMLQLSEDSYDELMDTNLKGPFFLTQAISRLMIESIQSGAITHPRIVFITSISAYTSSPFRAEYCLSKAGLSMAVALYADRLSEFGINVYEIRPGIIETDMTGPVHDKYSRMIAEGLTPQRRWGKPDDVAKAVRAIAEGYFDFSTGAIIEVSGGFSIRRL